MLSYLDNCWRKQNEIESFCDDSSRLSVLNKCHDGQVGRRAISLHTPSPVVYKEHLCSSFKRSDTQHLENMVMEADKHTERHTRPQDVRRARKGLKVEVTEGIW